MAAQRDRRPLRDVQRMQRMAGNRCVTRWIGVAGRDHVGQVLPTSRAPSGQLTVARKVDFEFDLNVGTGLTSGSDGLASADQRSWDETPLTPHRKDAQGFEVVQDGNRIEIGTKRFGIGRKGKAKMHAAFAQIGAFVGQMVTAADAVTPRRPKKPTNPARRGRLGRVRPFKLAGTVGDRVFFPLGASRYFRTSTSVAGAPQATFDVPLEKVSDLVKRIAASEGRGLGRALTGPRRRRSGKRVRPGLRSVELVSARSAVVAERARQIAAGTVLPSSHKVDATSFSDQLEGFMILLLSYLNTSEISRTGDSEAFAKAYPPVVTHTRFRDMFHRILRPQEREVFVELYGKPSARVALWKLTVGSNRSGAKQLFPAKARGIQEREFGSGNVPTWDDLIDKTLADSRLIDARGDESMFTPLAGAASGPTKAGPKQRPSIFGVPWPLTKKRRREIGTRLELRRIGYAWHPASVWKPLADRVHDLVKDLNS